MVSDGKFDVLRDLEEQKTRQEKIVSTTEPERQEKRSIFIAGCHVFFAPVSHTQKKS
jgi:hypothetical protein